MKPYSIVISLVFIVMCALAQDRTFSTTCPTCHRAIVKAVPLTIETNSIKEIVTAPDSGCSNYVLHVTLRCSADHTNRFRREFVLCEPTATEDPAPPIPHAEIPPPVPLPTNPPAATVRIIVEQPK